MQTGVIPRKAFRLWPTRRPAVCILAAALATLGMPNPSAAGKDTCNKWLPGCSIDLAPAFKENHTPQLVAGAAGVGAAVIVAVLLRHKGRAAPKMRVKASAVSFKGVQVGSSVDQSLTLRNEGAAPATISAIRLSGSSFSVANGPEVPITIPGRSQMSMQVSFAPQSIQNYSGKIEVVIVSAGAAKGQTKVLKVDLKGKGLPAQQASM